MRMAGLSGPILLLNRSYIRKRDTVFGSSGPGPVTVGNTAAPAVAYAAPAAAVAAPAPQPVKKSEPMLNDTESYFNQAIKDAVAKGDVDKALKLLDEAVQFSESLKNNQQFRFVYKNGRSYANKYFIMYVKENGLDKNRIGISVSKKVGNSVVRHRITRLVRESYRLHESVFNSGLDMVIIARPAAASIGYEEAESALLHLAKLHHLIKIYFYQD